MSTPNENLELPFSVIINLEVTAESKEKALSYAVSDINELHRNGTLEATIEPVDESVPMDATETIVVDYIEAYTDSNGVTLTDEQRKHIRDDLADWISEQLAGAVNEAITNIT